MYSVTYVFSVRKILIDIKIPLISVSLIFLREKHLRISDDGCCFAGFQVDHFKNFVQFDHNDVGRQINYAACLHSNACLPVTGNDYLMNSNVLVVMNQRHRFRSTCLLHNSSAC